jgi:uncharacterized protein (TIGR00266 family)
MQAEILYRPAYSIAKVTLAPGEAVKAESGAMVGMSPGVMTETAAQGGFMRSLKRSVLGGESFFMNTFRAESGPGEIFFAPALAGDVISREMAGETLMVQSGSYLASAESINVDTKYGGAKSFFASEGLILLRISGNGLLLLSSYGAIHEMSLPTGQRFTVDTGHLVSFTEGMTFNVRRIGGMKSTLFSGEGLVVDLTGPGNLMVQTRSQDAFLSWLIPKLPTDRD